MTQGALAKKKHYTNIFDPVTGNKGAGDRGAGGGGGGPKILLTQDLGFIL